MALYLSAILQINGLSILSCRLLHLFFDALRLLLLLSFLELNSNGSLSILPTLVHHSRTFKHLFLLLTSCSLLEYLVLLIRFHELFRVVVLDRQLLDLSLLELFPELLELIVIGLDEFDTLNDDNVLLVPRCGLEGPVE